MGSAKEHEMLHPGGNCYLEAGYDDMGSAEEHEMLRQSGLVEEEIRQLKILRRDYRQQATVELRRLEFARWLVTSGKLTEQIA